MFAIDFKNHVLDQTHRSSSTFSIYFPLELEDAFIISFFPQLLQLPSMTCPRILAYLPCPYPDPPQPHPPSDHGPGPAVLLPGPLAAGPEQAGDSPPGWGYPRPHPSPQGRHTPGAAEDIPQRNWLLQEHCCPIRYCKVLSTTLYRFCTVTGRTGAREILERNNSQRFNGCIFIGSSHWYGVCVQAYGLCLSVNAPIHCRNVAYGLNTPTEKQPAVTHSPGMMYPQGFSGGGANIVAIGQVCAFSVVNFLPHCMYSHIQPVLQQV